MKFTAIFLFTFLIILSIPASTAEKSKRPGVVYGQDDRQDLFQVTDVMKYNVANSTAALIYKENLEAIDNNETRIKGRSYASTYQLCTEEPFFEQQVAAFCSGFLVGPQTLVTAGHCIRQQTCERTRFVFGYGIKSAGAYPNSVPSQDVYGCKDVVHSQQLTADPGPDFAVVTLDRPVIGHNPLRLRTSGTIQNSEPVFVVGHPAGLPTKVAGGAQVRDSSPKAYFVANLDTYGGNSGSAVFNENTGEVEGILVRGELDYVTKKDANCQISNVCKAEGCMGEHVTKIEFVFPYLSF